MVIRKPGKDDYTKLKAYRSISLLSCMGKVVENVAAELLRMPNRHSDYQLVLLWLGFPQVYLDVDDGGRFEGRSAVRTWLVTIATNVCLTNLENKGRRPMPTGLGMPGAQARDETVTP